MDAIDERFRWSEEPEREVYVRCWPLLLKRYNKEFFVRFGRERNMPHEHDFPCLLNTIHYCFFNNIIASSDALIMTQSIYQKVLMNPLAVKNWPEMAIELSNREYVRLMKDIADSLRIK